MPCVLDMIPCSWPSITTMPFSCTMIIPCFYPFLYSGNTMFLNIYHENVMLVYLNHDNCTMFFCIMCYHGNTLLLTSIMTIPCFFFGNGNTLFLTWYHVLFMSYSVSFLRSEQSYQSKLIVCYLSYFPLCCQFPGVVPFGFPRCQISYLMGSLPDSVSFIIQHNGFYCHRSHKAPGRLVFHSYQWAVAFLAWVCCGM